MLSDFLGLSTGLDYLFIKETTRYFSIERDYIQKVTGEFTVHSLELPLRFVYKLNINDFKIGFNLGAKATADLSHSINSTGQYIDSNGKVAYVWEAKENALDFFSRFNLLVGPGISVGYKNFFINSGYDWGIYNMAKSLFLGKDIYRNQFYVKLGYQF